MINMNKLLTKLLSVFLAILTVFLLFSCSSGEKDEDFVSVGRKDNPALETDRASETLPPAPAAAGFASYSGSTAEGNLVYTTYKGKVISDFSFLDGITKDFFSDVSGDDTGSWFCGKTERDESTGEVTLIWDRAADVISAMEKYDAVYRKNTDKKTVYFTFDCGYENGYTNTILDILKEKNVKAIFFLNGHYIEESSDIVKRMLDEGHIIGNHGNTHQVMPKLSVDEYIYEIESNNELLRQYVPNAPYMRYYRPSYGSCSEWDMALAHEMDLTEVLYSWTYYDYEPTDQPAPADALELAKKALHNGEVVLFHTVGETNTLILGDFIDYIRSQGFEIGEFDK